MDVKTGFAAIGLGLCAAAPASLAQTTAPQVPSTIQGGQDESLSGKLSKSDGVIKPSGDVDPKMKAPAPVPRPNSTPVIPPSATGGENAK